MNATSTKVEQYVDNYSDGELAQMKSPRVNWSAQQLAQYLPNARGVARRVRKELIREVMALQSKYRVSLPRSMDMQFTVNYVLIDAPIQERMNQVAKIDDYLRKTQARKSVASGGITGEDIARAKNVPITDYLEFNRAWFANCLWHNEKSPSLHYHEGTNRVFCFGCGKKGDSIDVYMAQHNLQFISAVKQMLRL